MSALGRLGVVLLCWLPVVVSGKPMVAEDAFESPRALNPSDKVSVIVYSSPALQEKTREAGRILNRFLARTDFQMVVLVDLEGSLANWAKGYTRRRMQRDLKAKIDNLPAEVQNFHEGKYPRPDITVVPDFDGHACESLDWEKSSDKKLKVIVFDDGKVARRWEDLQDYRLLEKTVEGLLNE